jgi:hypothetical protein
MTAVLRSIDLRPAWKALEAHHQKVRELHLRKLFVAVLPNEVLP